MGEVKKRGKKKEKMMNEVSKVFWWFISVLGVGLVTAMQLTLLKGLFDCPIVTKLIMIAFFMGVITMMMVFILSALFSSNEYKKRVLLRRWFFYYELVL